MNALNLIQLVKDQYLNQIDNELYLSILVVLISNRNLLVSSTNTEETINQLCHIFNDLLNLEFIITDCSQHILIPMDTKIVILTNIDKTSVEYQQSIYPLFVNRMVIVVINNDDGVEVSLVDDLNGKILFRYPHEPTTHCTITDQHTQQINTKELIIKLQDNLAEVKMIQEIKRYINDIIIFLRNHRMVCGGLPTMLKYELETMIKTVAVLNNLNFVTPTIVKWSCERFLPLHLNLINDPSKEPTLNWGSELKLIKSFVDMWDQDLVVSDVLKNVQPPL